jgi:hypothetical protein
VKKIIKNSKKINKKSEKFNYLKILKLKKKHLAPVLNPGLLSRFGLRQLNLPVYHLPTLQMLGLG